MNNQIVRYGGRQDNQIVRNRRRQDKVLQKIFSLEREKKKAIRRLNLRFLLGFFFDDKKRAVAVSKNDAFLE